MMLALCKPCLGRVFFNENKECCLGKTRKEVRTRHAFMTAVQRRDNVLVFFSLLRMTLHPILYILCDKRPTFYYTCPNKIFASTKMNQMLCI